LRPQFKRTPWEIEIDVAPEILMDSFPGPLEQIVINLVTNSIRHGFEGRDHGCVRIVGRSQSPGWVTLLVVDDGIGISPAHLGRVFDPFFTTKLGQGGSGFGLSLVYRIATSVLGGSISVKSEVGRGAEFMLTIPAVAPAAG
jgi:signal transduction histidine kinase